MKKTRLILSLMLAAAIFSGCSNGTSATETTAAAETTLTAGAAAGQSEDQVNNQPKDKPETTSDINELPTIRQAGGDSGLPNPFKHHPRGPGMSKMQLLYDSLLEKDENGDIPWLAESWNISEDGTTYTFNLVQNAVWHDGTPLTAEDVAFTFSYYKEHSPIVNDLLVGDTYLVSEAKAVDTYTAEIKTSGFDNTVLTKLGGVRILPKHIWEKVEDPFAYEDEDATVASGPYILDTYDSAQGLYRYIANPNYWGPAPACAALEWIPVGDSTLSFENEEIDLINAAPDMLERYKNDGSFTVKSGTSYHSYRLMMNMEAVPELQDVTLRQAMAYAIDGQELVDKISRGAAAVSSKGYVPDTSPWYNSDIPQYPTDMDKARELLGGKIYSFRLLTDNSPASIGVSELIKLALADIGIEVTVESVEIKTRDTAIQSGEYELLLNNLGGLGGDPDYLRSTFSGSVAIKGWHSERFDELAAAQATARETAKRREMINEMQQIIADELPVIMLHGATDNFVFRTAKYDKWMFRYDHNKVDHNKLSYVSR